MNRTGAAPAAIDHMYVLDGGEAHVEDISQWSPGVDVGRPRIFSNNVYLLRRGDDCPAGRVRRDNALLIVNHDVQQSATMRHAPHPIR